VDEPASDTRTELGTLLGEFLRAVSFPETGRPSYDRIRDLFIDEARLINTGPDPPEISTVEGFIAPRQARVDSGELTAFEEVETADTTVVFGNVAHRLSVYEKRGTANGAAFHGRGVISTQFIRTPSGWRMSSMAWDDERAALA
jgi:hypothetical protein